MADLFSEEFNVTAGSESGDFEFVRVFSDNVQSLGTDGTSRAE